MKRILISICVLMLTAAMLTGCMKRAVEDASEAVSSAASEMKEDATKYGQIDKATEAPTVEETDTQTPTSADWDKMVENGEIDDDNNDPTDGDNIDDDDADNSPDDDPDEDNADGGEHNDETMNDGSSFI